MVVPLMQSSDQYKYIFKIADVIFEIISDTEIIIAPDFLPFLVVDCKYICSTIRFKKVEQLPLEKGTLVARDYDQAVYCKDKGTFERWFHVYGKDEIYGLSKTQGYGKTTSVFYKKGSEDIIKGIHQSFRMSSWEQVMNVHNRLLLHASLIQTDYGGILFAGPSGIGKSTQANLWVKHRNARMINGDRPILYKDEIWWACGSPLAGSSRCCVNEKVPVRFIVILGKANRCTLERMTTGDSFKTIYGLSTVYSWSKEYVERTIEMIQKLIQDIPVYHLDCTPDEKAIEIVENLLI